jgi:Ca2+/Na+ antiporter
MDFLDVSAINNNRFIWGITSFIFNIGARHVISDLGQVHMYMFSTSFFKALIVFSMFFMATRDVLIALLLSVMYVVVFIGLLHEKSKYSIIPKNIKEHFEHMSNLPNKEQYEKAKEIMHTYEQYYSKS